MSHLNKKRSVGFSLGVFATIAAILIVEWLFISQFVHSNSNLVFAVVATISGVIAGTFLGRKARNWLHS